MTTQHIKSPTIPLKGKTMSDEGKVDVEVGAAADKALGEVLYVLDEMLNAMNEPDWYDEVFAATRLNSIAAWRNAKLATKENQ